MRTDFQPAVRHLNTPAVAVVRICVFALSLKSLQKFLTVFLLFRFDALDETRTTGFVAHPITIYAFLCQSQFFGIPYRFRLSAAPVQGVTSYGLGPLRNPQQVGDL
jgi:hypothetical protein